MARSREGRKDAWEELHWDQDVARWVGPRRDEPPANRMRPGHDAHGHASAHTGPGLLD